MILLQDIINNLLLIFFDKTPVRFSYLPLEISKKSNLHKITSNILMHDFQVNLSNFGNFDLSGATQCG